MPATRNVTDASVDLQDELAQLSVPQGPALPLYRWRTDFWYVERDGRVFATFSRDQLRRFDEDGLVERRSRRRSGWTFRYQTFPGTPIHVYERLARSAWAAVVPGPDGDVRAETVAPEEATAVARTIGKAQTLRRLSQSL